MSAQRRDERLQVRRLVVGRDDDERPAHVRLHAHPMAASPAKHQRVVQPAAEQDAQRRPVGQRHGRRQGRRRMHGGPRHDVPGRVDDPGDPVGRRNQHPAAGLDRPQPGDLELLLRLRGAGEAGVGRLHHKHLRSPADGLPDESVEGNVPADGVTERHAARRQDVGLVAGQHVARDEPIELRHQRAEHLAERHILAVRDDLALHVPTLRTTAGPHHAGVVRRVDGGSVEQAADQDGCVEVAREPLDLRRHRLGRGTGRRRWRSPARAPGRVGPRRRLAMRSISFSVSAACSLKMSPCFQVKKLARNVALHERDLRRPARTVTVAGQPHRQDGADYAARPPHRRARSPPARADGRRARRARQPAGRR